MSSIKINQHTIFKYLTLSQHNIISTSQLGAKVKQVIVSRWVDPGWQEALTDFV